MSVAEAVPAPVWVSSRQTPSAVDHAKLCFLVRLAALYHNERGSLKQLSLAIGLSDTGLAMTVKRGQISAENAIAIEQKIGRSLFPRELFRPDLFRIPAE